MVQVQAADFCSSCLPFPQSVVDAVNTCLPIIANKHNDDLITIIKVSLELKNKITLPVIVTLGSDRNTTGQFGIRESALQGMSSGEEILKTKRNESCSYAKAT